MRLHDALDLCSDEHVDDWVAVPGERPATAMPVGLLDSGASEPRTTILAPHTIAIYEPDARLSLVWPVPDADVRDGRDRANPDWLEEDSSDWGSARDGWVVVLLSGTPIWQELLWYLDWGSGVGGYVPNFRPRYAERDGVARPSVDGWEVSAWEVRLARLINVLSGSGDFGGFDPTPRLVPSPSSIHPLDAARSGY
jgi:hypothetical protein